MYVPSIFILYLKVYLSIHAFERIFVRALFDLLSDDMFVYFYYSLNAQGPSSLTTHEV